LPEKITLASTLALDLNGAASKELTVTVDPQGADTKKLSVSWKSSDEAVATVTGTDTLTATVTGVKVGEATITATATVTKGDGSTIDLDPVTCVVTVEDTTEPGTSPIEGLTDIAFTPGSVTVATSQALANSPASLTISDVTASAKVDGGTEPSAFEISDIEITDEEVTKKSNYQYDIAENNTKMAFNITATATGGEGGKYTIKATGTITITGNASNGFEASISWSSTEQVTTS
jgi:Bacterial Ig-like domain (group 2).